MRNLRQARTRWRTRVPSSLTLLMGASALLTAAVWAFALATLVR